MARVDDINARMASMGIEDEENSELVFDEEAEDQSNKFETCLVGRFLTEKGLNFRVMKSKISDIWRPARGMTVKDLKPGLFLFQFYHIDDMEWVLNGGPWSFDNAMLVLSKINVGEDPLEVPLFSLQFWIQLFGVPSGLMTEAAGKQLGNFFGSFIAYDPNNNTSIWRECMRIKISIDVRQPLKRKKKICKRNGVECIVQCKYERLGDFCFVCGLVSHTERYCGKKVGLNSNDEAREWGIWLRAPARRAGGNDRSKFLRDERDADWDVNYGNSKFNQHISGDSGKQIMQINRQGRNSSKALSVKEINQEAINYRKDNLVLAANFKQQVGPSEEELIGLNIEESNKRRRGPEVNNYMEIEDGRKEANLETGLSNADCPASVTNELATLAKQASHLQ